MDLHFCMFLALPLRFAANEINLFNFNCLTIGMDFMKAANNHIYQRLFRINGHVVYIRLSLTSKSSRRG